MICRPRTRPLPKRHDDEEEDIEDIADGFDFDDFYHTGEEDR